MSSDPKTWRNYATLQLTVVFVTTWNLVGQRNIMLMSPIVLLKTSIFRISGQPRELVVTELSGPSEMGKMTRTPKLVVVKIAWGFGFVDLKIFRSPHGPHFLSKLHFNRKGLILWKRLRLFGKYRDSTSFYSRKYDIAHPLYIHNWDFMGWDSLPAV